MAARRGDVFGHRAYGTASGLHGHPNRPNAPRPNVVAKGLNQAPSALRPNIRNTFQHFVLREFDPMSPNPAPFCARYK